MRAVSPQMSAAPQPPRSSTDQPSGSQHEAGIRQTDYEPVVPAERLQELTFLDDCLSHRLYLLLVAPEPSQGAAART